MDCFLTAAFVFLLAQCASIQGKGIHVNVYAPLSDPYTVELMARIFVDNIVASGAFGDQGSEDFEDVIQSLIQAQNMGKGRHDSNAKAKAMQVALASSIAELVIAESEPEDVARKSAVMTDALRNALLQAFGEVNEDFVHEIEYLVQLFSSTQFNEINGYSGGSISESVSISVGGQSVNGPGSYGGVSVNEQTSGGPGNYGGNNGASGPLYIDNTVTINPGGSPAGNCFY